ncbi:FAD binding domain-containing protein [Paenibacillus sp. GCM10023250]|uniref:FAD binding domain-containing protein n=1 Tax=Paenibacillus sp. GCM10023250 TaxID=3252648 RepID=UPI00360D5578
MSVVWQPRDAAEAVRLKEAFGADAQYVGGGTWLSVQWENDAAKPAHLIDVGGVAGVKGLFVQGAELTIGAMTPLAAARRDPLVGRRAPLLREAARHVAAPAVRNLGTVGGNVASRTGDLLPALLAADAELIWHDGRGQAAEKLADWLLRLSGGAGPDASLLLQVKTACGDARDTKRELTGGRVLEGYRKIGRREAFTPSVATAAFRVTVTPAGEIRSVRLAAGGGAMLPQRLPAAEALLLGETMRPLLMEQLYDELLAEVRPVGDAFVSADYRRQTTAAALAAGLWQAWRESESA